MKYPIKLLFLFLLSITCSQFCIAQQSNPTNSNKAKMEILITFEEFFEATKLKDSKRIVKHIYPKLFDFVPKKRLIEAMDQANADTTINVQITNGSVDNVTDKIMIDETSFAIISYSFLLVMQMNNDEDDNANETGPLDYTYEMLIAQHGEENVEYQKEKQRININVNTKAFAIKGKTDKNWTFLEYKPSQRQLLDQIIPQEIIEMALPAPVPCKECNTLRDALAKPEMVESLIISTYMRGTNLDNLPSSIGQLTNLKILYLTGHSFTTVPKEIGNLQKLEELSFAECQLVRLPKEIFNLKNLKELLLYEHKFSKAYVKELKNQFKTRMPNTKVEF